MTTLQDVPTLIGAAKAKAKRSKDRISKIREHLEGQPGSESQVEELHAANVELELVAVDIFTLFEVRMQNHFKRGPFSRKLRSALLETGHTDLVDGIQKCYLAINVLKHGKGASYRELLKTPTTLFHVKPAESTTSQDENAPSGLIDIGVPGFFDGLAATLLQAHQFLENR
ncbi:hypothetical protein P775_26760 [Puniceibacterium antarcticum]|uniref:Uncharacterized protein n=1 Tax=Puniceibacterium antarcticum TaxID=1206336 RepID=A0A2G8QYE9_9RHOB|nr:hypothetical protein [Puniceibacterium antarcticum]PIL14309.1 hypothetical protein P775_26760 [Puniceibacterium antarcticum]